ncbi:hypothetical protein ARAM_003176 [Aspergillus rambellii]|uniref:DUF833 domain protein n=1 Tax=Aspergillus rambellii TaxID=308745 RepID=A0A0F8VPW8_9EURO|nr:hypothetical protein ARAM_003176 [Aspergillus rambellii]
MYSTSSSIFQVNYIEFLNRPTSLADWWPSPHTHVLGPRDLARSVHGTWLGITKHGRLAILTNFHEATCEQAVGLRSRGAIVNSWLMPARAAGPPTLDDFVAELQRDGALDQIGGFNLLCGDVGAQPLAVVSNRPDDGRVAWVAHEPGQTVAISNTHLGDRSWKKVVMGEERVQAAIRGSLQAREDEDALVRRLLRVLSTDTLPRLDAGVGVEGYLDLVQESIFIPVIGRPEAGPEDGQAVVNGELNAAVYLHGLYGTQKQTVVLIGHDGRVRYIERTLYCDDGRPVPEDERDRSFEFHVDQEYP